MPTLAVVSIHSDTGLPADDWQNTFTLKNQADGAVVASTAACATALSGFYEDIRALLSITVDTNQDQDVDFYDITGHLDGSPHGSPYASANIVLGGGVGAAALPSECAVCLTWEGQGRSTAPVESGGDRPKQRRTGRVYLGPLTASVGAVGAGLFQVTSTARTTILDAADALLVALDTIDVDLCVWSRADAALYVVEAFFVDNAFDTQRRRGEAPTVRERRTV